MQFMGYHINNLKSYRKYFCFADAAEALENGSYQEWLTGVSKISEISEISEHGEQAAGEDDRIIREIRELLDQISACKSPEQQAETEGQSVDGHYENMYQSLFLLFYALAHVPVTENDRAEIARAARSGAEKQTEWKQNGNRKQASGIEIFAAGEKYKIQIWKNNTGQRELTGENHSLFRWKKLVNAGTVPISVLLMDGEGAEASRGLNPGGCIWLLTLNGCFVKWGIRVQVHHRSFACVDREGHLIVNGYPMRGGGMVDFSFDQETGILGVDSRGELKQYSGLDFKMRTVDAPESGMDEKEKFAFACLTGKNYILVKENGDLLTNLADCPEDFFSWQAAERESMISAEYPCMPELPFPAAVVSLSDQLLGFETPDSRVGVWDRERGQLFWMEEK